MDALKLIAFAGVVLIVTALAGAVATEIYARGLTFDGGAVWIGAGIVIFATGSTARALAWSFLDRFTPSLWYLHATMMAIALGAAAFGFGVVRVLGGN